MNAASLEFIAFAAIAACAYNIAKPVAWRQATLLLANAYFLSTFGSEVKAYLPLAGFLLVGFAGVRLMQRPEARVAFVPFLVLLIGGYAWLKKYTVLPSASFLRSAYVTIGLSYILFRVLHLLIETRAGTLPKRINWASYLNYTLNFMTLVSGPIQRYEDFADCQLSSVRKPLNIFRVGEGLHRVIQGLFKVTVLSWLFLGFHQQALAGLSGDGSLLKRALVALAIAVCYAFYLYFNFSGYTDIVIGVGYFFRFTLPENFDRPFSSDNFMNFWSRWHITLSNWLKTYVYNPLLLCMMRRVTSETLEPFVGALALFVTFFLVGIWHGRTSEFVVFGFLQGLGVSANQMYRLGLERRLTRGAYDRLMRHGAYVAACRGLTFTWFTFSLVWFWGDWKQMGTIARALGPLGLSCALLLLFLGSGVLLSAFEWLRGLALSVKWNGEPLLFSRYSRTVVDTGLMVITLTLAVVLNTPTPDIVYKAF